MLNDELVSNHPEFWEAELKTTRWRFPERSEEAEGGLETSGLVYGKFGLSPN
jgi:hypothetical protein